MSWVMGVLVAQGLAALPLDLEVLGSILALSDARLQFLILKNFLGVSKSLFPSNRPLNR